MPITTNDVSSNSAQVLYAQYNSMWCQWFAPGRLFSPAILISSTNKTDRHDKTEILLKVALTLIPVIRIQNNSLIYIAFKSLYCVLHKRYNYDS